MPWRNAEKTNVRRTIYEKESKYGGKKGNLNVGKVWRRRQAAVWDPIQPMWKNGNRQHTIQSPDQQERLLGYTILSLC